MTYAVFLGEVALDEYYFAPRWPGLGDKVTVDVGRSEVGGTVANAACVFAGYGGSARFIYTLNESSSSDILCSDLRANGVDTSHVNRVPGLPDSKTVIVLADGEHTIFIPSRAFQSIELSADAMATLCQATYVYTTLVDARMLRSETMGALEVIQHARHAGAKLVLDLDVGETADGDEAFLAEADIIFINSMGAAAFEEQRGGNVAQGFLDAGTQIVVITRAERGCTVFRDGERIDVDGIDVEVVDVTGAGDTFCSSFLYSLTRSDDLALAAEFANAAAARSVTAHGPRSGVVDSGRVTAFGAQAGRFTAERAKILR